jgi:hypothetical protein
MRLLSFSFNPVCKYPEGLSVWRVRDIFQRSTTERSVKQVYMDTPCSQHCTHILKLLGKVAVSLEREMKLQILYSRECLGKLGPRVSNSTTRAMNPRRLKKI